MDEDNNDNGWSFDPFDECHPDNARPEWCCDQENPPDWCDDEISITFSDADDDFPVTVEDDDGAGTGTGTGTGTGSGTGSGTGGYDPKFDPASDQFDPMSGFTCAPTQENPSCYDKCKEQMEKNHEACEDFRKKVQEILKSRGCPSVVRAYKRKRSSCGRRSRRTYTSTSSSGGCANGMCSLRR